MKKRKCLFPKCKILLNSYNQKKFCYLHQRTIAQNNLCYSRGKFYSDRLPTKKEKKKKLHLSLSVEYLLRLKNIVIDLPDEVY